MITYPNTDSSNSNLAEFCSQTWASQDVGFAGVFVRLLQRHGCDVSTADHIILFMSKSKITSKQKARYCIVGFNVPLDTL